jgi:hypothetical protein
MTQAGEVGFGISSGPAVEGNVVPYSQANYFYKGSISERLYQQYHALSHFGLCTTGSQHGMFVTVVDLLNARWAQDLSTDLRSWMHDYGIRHGTNGDLGTARIDGIKTRVSWNDATPDDPTWAVTLDATVGRYVIYVSAQTLPGVGRIAANVPPDQLDLVMKVAQAVIPIVRK